MLLLAQRHRAGPVGDALLVTTGPRRVGKGVALLGLAAELCGRRKIQPFRVIHVPCDGIAARDLRRTFTPGGNSPARMIFAGRPVGAAKAGAMSFELLLGRESLGSGGAYGANRFAAGAGRHGVLGVQPGS